MTRLTLAVAVAASLSLTALARAQDAAPEAAAPPDRTEELLSSLTGCDEGLLGTHEFGIYLQGRKNIGLSTVKVERAPDASGATYRVEFALNMAMAGVFDNRTTATAMLDEQLAMLSFEGTDLESSEGTESRKEKRYTLEDGVWRAERNADGQVTRHEVTAEAPNHWDVVCMLLLVRKLDLESPGVYRLSGIHWSALDGDEGDDGDEGSEAGEAGPATGAYRGVTVTVGEAAPFAHRGQTVQAVAVRIEREGDDTALYHLAADHRVLAFGPVGPPVGMVAGTSEEVRKDMEVPNAEEAAGPLGAVKVYFDVVAKQAEVSALDGVMDWEAIFQEMAAESPEVKALGAAGVASLLKSQFEQAPQAIGPAQVEMLMGMLEASVDGDAAKVAMPGKEDAFELRKDAAGAWRITHFPH